MREQLTLTNQNYQWVCFNLNDNDDNLIPKQSSSVLIGVLDLIARSRKCSTTILLASALDSISSLFAERMGKISQPSIVVASISFLVGDSASQLLLQHYCNEFSWLNPSKKLLLLLRTDKSRTRVGQE